MNSCPINPRALDVVDFASATGHLQGRWHLTGMLRLADLIHREAAASSADVVDWQADGERRQLGGLGPQPRLHLRLSARLVLVCQRCLAPVDVSLAVDRGFYFVDGESLAEQLDAESDDDVMAVTRILDLHTLAEDELLLALPLVPRHELCLDPLMLSSTPETQARQNPFIALAALKRSNV